MQFFKIWAKASHRQEGPKGSFNVSCYGFSNESLEDALRVAEERARKTADSLATGRPRSDGYYGSSHPFREEVVEELSDGDELVAILSRNHYGCLVLNTTNVLFADVDKPDQQEAVNPLQTILSLFGAKTQQPKSFEQDLIDRISNMCEQNAALGFRLYRTTLGYRVILTNQTVPAMDSVAQDFLKRLGSDKLYVSLCRSQDCYRARLTPKPWRCGLSKPPVSFPFESDAEEQTYRQWQKSYEQAIQSYATCALIGQFGADQIDPSVEKIVSLHDHYTLNGNRPLA